MSKLNDMSRLAECLACLAGLWCAAGVYAQTLVDVHSHIIVQEYAGMLCRHDAALEETFPLPDWDERAQLSFMDSAGIGTAVLTMPAPQPYFGDVAEAASCIRLVNERCAEVKGRHAGRFLFCAALPLPDVGAAVAEAVYALDTLGADGVKLATNSRGQYLGDAALDTLMQVLDDRSAVVIIHPHKPVPCNEDLTASVPLAMNEYPAETTRAVVNMLARNVPARYPHIKFVVPHCGSFLPPAIPRMKSILPAMVAAGYMQPIDWDANLRNLYYDLAGNPTMDVIRALLTVTTPDHIMYGSDYPYLPASVLLDNAARLRRALEADAVLSAYAGMFLWGNAARLFGINHFKQQ